MYPVTFKSHSNLGKRLFRYFDAEIVIPYERKKRIKLVALWFAWISLRLD